MKIFSASALTTLLVGSLFGLSHLVHAEVLDSGLDTSDEPLPPEQAFVLSTMVIDADMVRAEWDIVDGYYLYKEKFKFSSASPDISLEEASYPKGKIKEDEFFGKVETYRGKIGIDIPLKRMGNADNLELNIVSQGCADIGICYPPQRQQVSLKLPVMPALSTADAANDSGMNPMAALKKLGDSLGLGGSDDDFLQVDQAFAFTAEVENGNQLTARWDIADGYYLYRDKFAFSLENAEGVEIGQITMPPGKEKVDESFGKMVVYLHQADIQLPLNRTAMGAMDINLIAKYQGCAEKGLCYPPQTRSMPLSLPETLLQKAATAISGTAKADPTETSSSEVISEQDQIAASLASGNSLLTIITFFGFGLLLAFTPCVFPMIPILSSIIIGQGEGLSTRKAFTMSLVYVLAMAITYTFAGVIAGLFGQNLQAAFQNPWILSSFAAIFVALAFSMFGFYDIQMPSFIQSRLTEISNKQQGGTLVGVGIMGFLSALIVGPCVAAPLAGALIYIGQTGDAVLGGAALFALSLGMGAPLLAIGTSAGKLMPRAGGWMDAVKGVFGVMMLAVAIWMLERILPGEMVMILWAILLVVSAIYMGALEQIKEGASGWLRLWKGVGTALLIYGALLLIGAASGGKDALQPLANFGFGGGATASAHQELVFQRVKGSDGLDQAISKANAQGKMVFLDFYADWCISCKEMEKYTFSDPSVQKELANMVLIQADVTDNDDADQALLKRFNLVGPPAILFFDKTGKEKRNYRLVGFLKVEKFLPHIRSVQN